MLNILVIGGDIGMLLEYVKRYEKSSIITSILMLIVSILLILMPETILNSIVVLLGIAALLDGILHSISYIITDKEMKAFSNELFFGILEIMTSGLLFLFKANIINIFPVIIGIWIIIAGVTKFQLAFNLRGIDSKWIDVLLSSIISIILGVLIILNPFSTVMTITVISGIILFITEICNLIESAYLLIKLK